MADLLKLAVLAMAVLVQASAARADAIEPFDGDCPPGLESAIRDHAEVCSPMACSAECPAGSSCISLFECWARRPVPVAPFSEETREIDIVVGACDADRHCAEGACRERRQCEPNDPTPAWDRAERRWTRVSHPARSSGCHVGARSNGAWWGLLAVALAARRMTRGARRR